MVCRHVVDGAPILCAARDEPFGVAACEWQFGCGAEEEGAGDQRLVPLEEIVRRDPSAVEIVLHPRGTALERESANARWHIETGPVLFPHRPSRRWPRFDPRYPPRRGEPLDAGDLRVIADVAQPASTSSAARRRAAPPRSPSRSASSGRSTTPRSRSSGSHPTCSRRRCAGWGTASATATGSTRGTSWTGSSEGRAVAFRRIVPRHYPPYLGYAVWYHGGARFPALQATWADPARPLPVGALVPARAARPAAGPVRARARLTGPPEPITGGIGLGGPDIRRGPSKPGAIDRQRDETRPRASSSRQRRPEPVAVHPRDHLELDPGGADGRRTRRWSCSGRTPPRAPAPPCASDAARRARAAPAAGSRGARSSRR